MKKEIVSNNGVSYTADINNDQERLYFEPAGIEIIVKGGKTKEVRLAGKVGFGKEETSLLALADDLYLNMMQTLTADVPEEKREAEGDNAVDKLASVMLQYTKGAEYSHRPNTRDLKIWHLKQLLYNSLPRIFEEAKWAIHAEDGSRIALYFTKAGILRRDNSSEDGGSYYKIKPEFEELMEGRKPKTVLRELRDKCSGREGILRKIDDYVMKNLGM